ncbi:hypothetical protein Tco_0935278, partial [Tanacetum coccineum]
LKENPVVVPIFQTVDTHDLASPLIMYHDLASPLVIKPAYTNALGVATPSSYAPKGLPAGAFT